MIEKIVFFFQDIDKVITWFQNDASAFEQIVFVFSLAFGPGMLIALFIMGLYFIFVFPWILKHPGRHLTQSTGPR